MNKTAKQLAAAGRDGDSLLGHLTPGEVVIPRHIAPLAMGLLSDAGIDPQQYQVGRKANSRNPATGLLEFRYDDGSDRSDSGANDAGGDQGGGDMGGADQREASRRERAGLGEGGWDANGSREDGKYGRPDGSFGTKDRVASFGIFGNDMGSGILRARTPAELASYGISRNDLANLGAGSIGVIAPGASMPRAQKTLQTLGMLSPLPGGSAMGSMLGSFLDNRAIRSAMSNLGYDDQMSAALAAGQTAPGALRTVAGPFVSAIAGPYAGLANKFVGSPLEQRAADLAFKQTLAGETGNQTQRQGTDSKDGISSLMAQGPRPLGQLQPSQAVATSGGYAPGQVTAMQWSPIQWGAQYDPLLRG